MNCFNEKKDGKKRSTNFVLALAGFVTTQRQRFLFQFLLPITICKSYQKIDKKNDKNRNKIMNNNTDNTF